MKLFFREYGEENEEKLLILHGLFGMSDNWVSPAKKLAEKYHCIIPDHRNHGQSMHHNVFSYEAMLEDLEELIDDHDIYNCNVLGHSMGGKLGMYLALNNPGLVQKLVIADISPVNYRPTRHAELLKIMQNLDFSTIKDRKEIENYLIERLDEKRMMWFVMKNIKMINREQYAWKLNIQSIMENIVNIFEFDISGLSPFSEPTLFLKGGNSEFILDEHEPQIKKLFPNSEIKTIANAGHWMHADQPEEFLRLTASFLVAD
jgi:pimeloyl-ACP methyl ester carboxylesterase